MRSSRDGKGRAAGMGDPLHVFLLYGVCFESVAEM